MHSLDAKWLSRNPLPSTNRVLLQKQYEEVVPGVTAIKVGGHFEGSMVLHWEGHLFIADTFVNVPVSVTFPPFRERYRGLKKTEMLMLRHKQSGFYRKNRPKGTTSFAFMWYITHPQLLTFTACAKRLLCT
jgi:hypothetical protein